ncbi:NPC intracellular cholesterol transporter 2 [Bufo bufo]|uniref:NPC intracellular cholesterol transporter 2 n=1 Tax=Bufo bufo TaxID=8384 RepID=UPI001ABECA5D|nr:NPC intracellular cholesterol transporter 2 [Bufo bufo]XP_040268287.1 NPC intracellular cholesterol transporter 2 [Bufo bufo]
MSLSALAVALLCVAVVAGEPLVYKDCGCQQGKLISVDVSPCPKQPCPLVRGSTYTINVTFTSEEATPSCSAIVHGKIAGIPVPFPLPESDGCKSGLSCPLKSGEGYTYVTKMDVKPQYPKMKLVVKWELRDANNMDLFCWEIPVEITDG